MSSSLVLRFICLTIALGGCIPAIDCHAGPVETYDAYADFSTTTNSATSIWSYRFQNIYAIPGVRLAAPTLHTMYGAHWPGNYVPGPDNFSWSSPNVFGLNWPGIAINTGAPTTFFGHVHVPAKTLWTTPRDSGLGGMSVLSWLAPHDGIVDVDFSVTNINTGGNGIRWFLDKNGSAGNLAADLLGPNEGQSTGLLTIPNINVVAGDRINLVFEIFDFNNGFDEIAFSQRITYESAEVPEPSTLVLTLTALGALVTRKRARHWLRTTG